MPDSPNDAAKGDRPSESKGLSMEKRLLFAFLLMMGVLFLTPYFYRQPDRPPSAPPAREQAQPTERSPFATATEPEAAPEPAVIPVQGEVSAPKEETFTIETDLYRIGFSNRGAVVRSWVLTKYKDNAGQPLELVNAAGVAKAGYPFSLDLKGGEDSVLNQALYVANLHADGRGVDFEFSDGNVFNRKSFRFRKDSYLSEVSSEVVEAGRPVSHLLEWRGGFGDRTVPNHLANQHSLRFDLSENKLITGDAKDANDGPVSVTGNFLFAGLEDSYFAAVFLADGGSSLEVETFNDVVPDEPDGEEEPHVGAAVGRQGQNRFSLFVGPKDLDILRKVNPKLEQVVDFGWFALLSKPLFLALNWVNDRYVQNYGWSIVMVTIIINFLLLPLKFTSLKSMKKMQALQPLIAAINERYKGIGIRDARKAEQNQEVMGLYKKHGVNPMGGCFPMLLQIPFFIAFYKVLTVSIELRGASWLWVTDLSQPEHLPIRILPVTMIISQFVMQKMTPATTPDPTQQRMMLMMPLVLGFVFYGVSSGLVLYWLTGNLVGIAQQLFFNRTFKVPVIVPEAPVKKKRKGGRK
jgi:YidC/Oxa1 family membrane protein insertase